MPSLKPWRLAGVMAVALALVTGCSAEDFAQDSAAAATRVFKADNGDITIPTQPKRIVATGYAVPVLIEADAELAGISSWKRGLPMMAADDRAAYDKLTKVAGEMAAETNYEAIAKVDPDLIVIGVPKPALGDLDMKRLESIAPVVVIGPTLPDGWRELSQRQSDAAGRLANFTESKAAYEKKAGELKAKYADVLKNLKFGHVGAYGEVQAGTFHREFAGSWGTNIAQDIGVNYYGGVAKKGGGAEDVTEYPSIEDLPDSLGEADAVTYTAEADGKALEPVRYVLDHKLWKNLPAVEDGKVFGIKYTEAATYAQAMKTLDALDQALQPLLAQ